MSKAANIFNDNVHTLYVPYKNSGGHPKVAEQKIMADDLTRLIKSFKLDPVTVSFTVQNESTEEAVLNAKVVFNADTLISDNEGNVVFDAVQMGQHSVSVELEGFSIQNDFGLGLNIYSDTTLTLNLAPKKYSMKIFVKDAETDEKIKGALITIDDETKKSSSSGYARFKLTYGEYEVIVTADGYKDKTQNIFTTDELQAELFLNKIPTKAFSLQNDQNTTPIVFPNPVKNSLFISGIAENCQYKISSLKGVVIQSGFFHNNGSINVDNLPKMQHYLLQLGEMQAISFYKN